VAACRTPMRKPVRWTRAGLRIYWKSPRQTKTGRPCDRTSSLACVRSNRRNGTDQEPAEFSPLFERAAAGLFMTALMPTADRFLEPAGREEENRRRKSLRWRREPDGRRLHLVRAVGLLRRLLPRRWSIAGRRTIARR